MSKRDERLENIYKEIQLRQSVSIADLSRQFSVSEMTIRRDLQVLSKNDLVLLVPGMALLKNNLKDDAYTMEKAAVTNVESKDLIARAALKMISDNECIIIDSGTTTERLATKLPDHIKLTVMTCNVNIFNRLASKPDISLICGGGYFHPEIGLFESAEGVELIKKTRASKVFASASGVHPAMGVTCLHSFEVAIKRAMLDSAAEKILLVDPSKFDQIKPCFLTEISVYNKIVTTRGLPESWIEMIDAMGVEVVIAEEYLKL